MPLTDQASALLDEADARGRAVFDLLDREVRHGRVRLEYSDSGTRRYRFRDGSGLRFSFNGLRWCGFVVPAGPNRFGETGRRR